MDEKVIVQDWRRRTTFRIDGRKIERAAFGVFCWRRRLAVLLFVLGARILRVQLDFQLPPE